MHNLVRPAAAVTFLAAGVLAATACAQVVAPSTFTTAIHVQGEAAGTEYADWAASGIPIVDMDPADNVGDIDIANIQIANDADFIYIYASLHNTSSISLASIYLGFDTDQDKATGFDVLQIGEIGSEFAYQNDFPFAQYTGLFNLNLSITGGPLSNGGALIYPYWTEAGPPSGVGMEWAIPLKAVIQYPPALGGPKPAFPNPSFNFVIYTDQGLADISQVISYTLAQPPAGTPGDFDADNDVDGEDFLIWQRGFGGAYDANDLADWKAHFGGAATASLAASVPEPTAAALVAIACAAMAHVRRRNA
ncbi:hypothetical protein [Lacipirellula limnantheis]|uniref:PEP-CTERM protein-sorting domain-containing protein n=1 Tax=Lacipirellula limnantheis TaxID=2528024 RepID=A0A517TSN1_9BACT|nr:hypothetical protein [Lacipirellula limnantheis]QDT71384.1 hypothetical protein I41_05410 [Lacipirellula limnantheis]